MAFQAHVFQSCTGSITVMSNPPRKSARCLPNYDRKGSLGDEIRADQLLPFRDRKADVAYQEIIAHRGNWLDCPLSDL